MNISNKKSADKRHSDNSPVKHQEDIEKTPEDAVKEPLTPVPAVDEINPPLEATLGGDDVVIAPEKKQ